MQEDAAKNAKDAAPTGTQTLLRGLAVVQAVAGGARDLKEIARLIGTTRSTTHRLASCLVDERYLRVVPQVGYLLGPKLIELGFQAREALPLVTLAGPYLDELSALTGDTIHLAIREDDDVLYLHKNPGRNGPEMRSRVGHRMPLARTGIGKALLLDDSPQEWQRLYRISLPVGGKNLSWPAHHNSPGSSFSNACWSMWRVAMPSIWKTMSRRSAVSRHRYAMPAGRSSPGSASPVPCPTCRWRRWPSWSR